MFHGEEFIISQIPMAGITAEFNLQIYYAISSMTLSISGFKPVFYESIPPNSLITAGRGVV